MLVRRRLLEAALAFRLASFPCEGQRVKGYFLGAPGCDPESCQGLQDIELHPREPHKRTELSQPSILFAVAATTPTRYCLQLVVFLDTKGSLT